MLFEGRLERVPPSREQADFLIRQARQHLQAATAIAKLDPPGGYQLAYDAARKSLTAVLENQGLRPTHTGGHVVVYEALRAQLDPPLGAVITPFNRMRRTRNESEYPRLDRPGLHEDDVREVLPKVEALIDLAERILDQMDVF
ncbi:HEPN domain-containing protein [uncultured Friedmanniella sp.]|uniref:HEPN domain-containing protein n=1 Tax=uncultured Friedmanniella sp. TaxID=335381 RepID=UPI0035C9F43E